VGKPALSEITSRPARDCEEDCKAIFDLLLIMHKEVGRHALNHVKAWNEVCTCVRHGAAYMVFRGDELIASAGLRIVSPYYSDEELFADQWFYVRKDCREDGRAFRALMKEAQRLANDTGMPVQIKIYDPDRPSRSKTTTIAEDFFFGPSASCA
jgi:hypothetical protein